MMKLIWKSKEARLATVLFVLVLLSFNNVKAQAAGSLWKLEVVGFGTTVRCDLLADEQGRTYLPIEDLAAAFKVGLKQSGDVWVLKNGGNEWWLAEGSLSISGKAMSAPVRVIDGKMCFPVKDITFLGYGLQTDEKAKLIKAVIPRGKVLSMGMLEEAGPPAYYVRLSHSPARIESFVLPAPDRLVIDLYEITADPASSIDLKGQEAQRIRASMNKPGVARVVLELTSKGAGAKVYQDPHDPSLLIISYPSVVKSVAPYNMDGLDGILIDTTAFVRYETWMTSSGKLGLYVKDSIPLKSMPLKGEGWSAEEQKQPWTAIVIDGSGRTPGELMTNSTSLFVPLLTRLKRLSYSAGDLQGFELMFASPVTSYSCGQDDDGFYIIAKGVSPLMPEKDGTAVYPKVEIEPYDDNSARIRFPELDGSRVNVSQEEAGKLIRVSFGGLLEAVSLYNDNGVRRLTFKYTSSKETPVLSCDPEGRYVISFKDINVMKDGIPSGNTEGVGIITWQTTEEGLKCVIMPEAGKKAVARNSPEGTFVLDVGYYITGCLVVPNGKDARITITASGPADPDIFRLREPDRLVIDLPGFVEGPQRTEEVSIAGVLRSRSGQNTIGVARLVFDIEKYVGHTWTSQENGSIVEIVMAQKLAGLTGRLILIDPGHGGKDGGAAGNSLVEKDINLDISLRLRSLLEAQGAVVVMTRSSDIKLELTERSVLANLLLPDVVVCIHSNSVISPVPNGTEVYYFNNEELSKELASSVQKSLVDRIKLASRGLFRKDYHMVKEPQSPSVLVEVGFLSNKQDAAQLADSLFRAKAAEGIFDGLVSYFSGTAPDKWAAMREGLGHAAMVPPYKEPEAAWPGLYLERPWKPEPVAPQDSVSVDPGEQEGK